MNVVSCLSFGLSRFFEYLVKMPPGCLPLEICLACPTGRRNQGRPRTQWMIYISCLDWEHLWGPMGRDGKRRWGVGDMGFSSG